MTTELTFTVLSALLATSLWIPYIVGVNSAEYDGQEQSFVRPPDQRNMLPWIHRAYRAHLNMIEQFVPFAVLVLVGHAIDVSTPVLGYLAMAFFTLR
ncbi:MAG: MAPEG family protein, partial [Pseudomonadota bacterium]